MSPEQTRRRRRSRRRRIYADPEEDPSLTSRRHRRHGRLSRRRLKRLALVLGIPALAIIAAVGSFFLFVSKHATGSYESALELFQGGDYRGAIITLKNVLREEPEGLSARILIGRAYLKIGYAKAAEQELRRARQSGADDAVILTPLAYAYLQQGKFGELFKALPENVRYPELQAGYMTLRGKAHLQLRELDRAETAFTQAVSLSPDAVEPVLGRAQIRLYRGLYSEAEELTTIAAEMAPESAEPWYVKSEIRRAQKDNEAALEFYDRALQADPHHVTARLARAATLIDMDYDSLAQEDLNQVWRVRPEDPQAYYLYALILSKMNEMEKAQAMLKRASMGLMRTSTDFLMRHPPSLLLMGVIYYRNERYEDAYALFDRFISMEPRHVGARKLMASVQLKRNLAKGALDSLLPALKISPDDPELLTLLSQAYNQAGEPDRAAELLERASRLNPDSAEIKTQLAFSRLVQGKKSEAMEELESALILGDGSERAAIMLGLMQLRQGDFGGALATARTLIRQQADNPAAHNLEGSVLLAEKKLAEARESFNRALEKNPDYIIALHNLAKIDIHDADEERAKQRYRRILELAPKDINSMIALAEFDRRAGDIEGAIMWLEKARAVDPKALSPQLDLIELYLQSNKKERAGRLAKALESRFPKNVAVLVAKGRVELASGNRGEASETFRQVTGRLTDSIQQLLSTAKYQLAANDISGARKTLNGVIEQAPEYLPAYAASVELELRAGRLKEALEIAQNAQQARPDLPLGDMLSGDVLMQMRRYREALDSYRTGIAKRPATELVVRLYRAQRSLGRTEEGLGELSDWLREHPDDLVARRALASAYIDGDRNAEALEMHEALLAELPEDAALLNNLAGLYLKSGDLRALEYARKAHQLEPRQAATLDTLGWVLVGLGQYKEGLRYLREAHNRAAQEPTIHYHIGAALKALGRNTEARRSLERALSLDDRFDGAEQAQKLLGELKG